MQIRATLAISFLILATGVPANAAPTPAQRADATLKEGLALDKAGKAEAALQKFEDAYAIVPSGVAAYNIAREESSLGRHALALQHFREALRDTKLTTDQRRDAEAQVETLKTKIGVLTLDVPEGATTTVDGNELDPKQPAEVPPGMHVVKIRLGGESKSQDVTATAGSVTPVKLRFDAPVPPAPPPPPALPPEHHLWNWPTPKLVTVGAGAVIGAGLLTTSLVIAVTKDVPHAPAAGECVGQGTPACSELKSSRDSYTSIRTAATVLFYSGLVVAAGTVVAALLWPNEQSPAASWLANPVVHF